jgi:hypothetical protein
MNGLAGLIGSGWCLSMKPELKYVQTDTYTRTYIGYIHNAGIRTKTEEAMRRWPDENKGVLNTDYGCQV